MKTAFLRMLLILCFCIALCMLFACQPTPEEEAVIGKGDGKLEELIVKTPSTADSGLQPQRWEHEIDFPESGVKVVIDADIEVPAVQELPAVLVTPHDNTPEEAQKYVNIFMQGQPIFKAVYARTQEVVQQDILDIKARIEGEKSNTGETEEDRQSSLEFLNSQLQTLEEEYLQAPEDIAKTPATVQFKKTEDTNLEYDWSMEIQADLGKSMPASLSILFSEDNYVNYITFKNEDTRIAYSESFDAKEVANGMNISLDDAQQQAEELLEKLGIEDVELASAKIGTSLSGKLSPDDPNILLDPATKQCYIFHFCRKINGVGMNYFEICYGFDTEKDEPVYSKTWDAEEIYVAVDDTGIIEFRFLNRGDIKETVNPNVALLDFDSIKQIFEKQITYQRVWSDSVTTSDSVITIKKIVLGLARVKMKDDTYMLMPVWDFVGGWSSVDMVGGGNVEENKSFLTINAVDGSVIDPRVGY
jgi:hypothetical protein